MLFNPARRCCLLWRSLAAWRAWKSGPSSCHSSSVSVHSGPGSLDGSTQLSSVSAENPPHTPVMLKEVLHYLDIQQGQVCNHVCCSVKDDYCVFFFNVHHALKPILTQHAEALASCAYLSVTHKDISIQHTYKIQILLPVALTHCCFWFAAYSAQSYF